MTSDLPIYLLIVTIFSFIINFIVNKYYKINPLKLSIFTILSTIFGALSTMVMSFVETGSFKGTSFYGAIFLMPVFVVIFAIIAKELKWKLMNLTAFLGMITSALLKYRCFDYGCCVGRRVMYPGGFFVFPSQLAEMFFAIILFIVLIVLFAKNKERKDLFPLLMVMYGVGRYFFNSYRLVFPVFMGLANGHIWSILSVIIGTVWLIILKKQEKKQKINA